MLKQEGDAAGSGPIASHFIVELLAMNPVWLVVFSEYPLQPTYPNAIYIIPKDGEATEQLIKGELVFIFLKLYVKITYGR